MRKTCGIFVDIEDAAQESKDQTCIATGTKNNGCFDKCRCIVKKQTDQSTGKKSENAGNNTDSTKTEENV